MSVVKVLRHGQITQPKTLREVLDIKEGDILEIELERSRLILKTKMLVDKERSTTEIGVREISREWRYDGTKD